LTEIAILHYAAPPTVGGVETTIAHHARGLRRMGYRVRLIAGAPSSWDASETSIPLLVDSRFSSSDAHVLALKRDLDRGIVPEGFSAFQKEVTNALRDALRGCPICIAHNVPTLHKNLALSAALETLCQEGAIRLIAWCHDLAWTNDLYAPELHPGEAWDVIRRSWVGTRYVTVSEARRQEVARLLDLPPPSVMVIPPGVDLVAFLHWTPAMQHLAEMLNLPAADVILLLPARLTRRKNIALALSVLAHLRRLSGADVRLVVTGPPGAHNPANPGYLGELLNQRAALGLEDSAHFLYALGEGDTPFIPDDATLANLYGLADALFFPSTQEGFGIPMLEAGLVGLPIFCADLPPLRETGGETATYFDPVNAAPQDLAAAIWNALRTNQLHTMRVRVRQHYCWEAILRNHLHPLIQSLLEDTDR